MYYWINVYGDIEESDTPLSIEADLKRFGNYFPNKAQAVSARNKIYSILKLYASAQKDDLGAYE